MNLINKVGALLLFVVGLIMACTGPKGSMGGLMFIGAVLILIFLVWLRRRLVKEP